MGNTKPILKVSDWAIAAGANIVKAASAVPVRKIRFCIFLSPAVDLNVATGVTMSAYLQCRNRNFQQLDITI
jgi:hypothetical protein